MIREASRDDVPQLAVTLAEASAFGPWTSWVVDHRDHGRRLRELYAIYLQVALRFGSVWMTEDGDAAAAWTWSDDAAAAGDFLETSGLGAAAVQLAGDRAQAGAEAAELIAGHGPAEPHWRLEAVGVRPARQGAGLGTSVLRPMLDRCDAEARLAALETSLPDNVRLYRRLGFEVTAEPAVPGGPPLWLMAREPRPS